MPSPADPRHADLRRLKRSPLRWLQRPAQRLHQRLRNHLRVGLRDHCHRSGDPPPAPSAAGLGGGARPGRRWLAGGSLALAGILLALSAIWALRHGAGGGPSPVSRAEEALASGPLQPRDLALVINSADPLSEAIGQYYQRARRIPADQVIRVRFRPGPTLPVSEFVRVYRQVRDQTPAQVQAYALAWAAPWRVGCVSITSAFGFGRLRSGCGNTCASTPANPWYARGDIHRPWRTLGLRPTMLLAASSAGAARALIDRGVAADGSAPEGTVYLLNSSDRLRNVRAAGFPSTAALLGASLRLRLLSTDALGAPDILALFTGLSAMPGLASNRFRPGAVADHLTSSGGMLTGPSGTSADGGFGQMSALRWLEAGATGSYGTVVEPCNLASKFPHPGLLLTYYHRGDTLLESYWRSVAMPEQGVFIGEPLARPWPARR